jgi:hypothetical protein
MMFVGPVHRLNKSSQSVNRSIDQSINQSAKQAIAFLCRRLSASDAMLDAATSVIIFRMNSGYRSPESRNSEIHNGGTGGWFYHSLSLFRVEIDRNNRKGERGSK